MFGGLFALTGGSLQNDACKQQQEDGTDGIIAFHEIPRFWVDAICAAGVPKQLWITRGFRRKASAKWGLKCGTQRQCLYAVSA
ncbi:hypothetical protein DWZ97_04655 [Firmicutes bacterium AF36-19BH]|nr:hypothetical protein DWZ97_04655 [Firmicutes bacterium AF36-19BH]